MRALRRLFSRPPRSIAIAPVLCEIASVFIRHGKKVYLVGGAVRDALRAKAVSDWDLATDALPEEVMSIFRRVIPTGVKHGTVTILFKGHSIEVTTLRTESDYQDGRRPGALSFISDIEADLSRRDFTMNAIAAEMPSGALIDPFHGAADIQKGIIRCVGDAAARFAEDGLRPLRALRFAATLAFTPERSLLAAIAASHKTTALVSAERVRAEFEKIIMSGEPGRALRLMRETGLLKLLLPELDACAGVEQKGFHRFDVWNHSLLACEYAARRGADETVRLAALFHDVGKPLTARRDDEGIWTFYQHERESARLCRSCMTRLRFPKACIETTAHLIEQHMFHYEDSWSAAAVRRFIIRTGKEHIDALFELRMADAYGKSAVEPPPGKLLPFRRRIDAELEKRAALSLKDLAINGGDLIQMGFTPGPRIGAVLRELFDAVLADSALNERAALRAIAAKMGPP
jgi:putative nucleotidyltransferase with HDIG domain